MEHEQDPYGHLWSDPSATPAGPPAKRRRVPKVAATAGLTALFVMGGAGIALAVSGSGSSKPAAATATPTSTTVPGPGPGSQRPGGRMRGPGGPGVLGGLGPDVVHGQATLKQGSGYKTFDYQVGSVKEVSASSITVTSSDGFTRTYKVEAATIVDSQAGGISAVAVKDEVRVTALDGATPTATDIVDRTKIAGSHDQFGIGRPGRFSGPPAGEGGPPAPSSTSSA